MESHSPIPHQAPNSDPFATEPATSVAILAGGRSVRFGSDKALAPLSTSTTLLGAVINQVGGLSDDLFVVTPSRPEYARFGVPLRPDLYGETGVLGAMASAIRHGRYDRCLIVSCDMPLLHRELLQWMIEQPIAADALVPRTNDRGRQGAKTTWQTLHAIYRKSCLPAIESALGAGERRSVSFFGDIAIQAVDEDTLRRFDPNLRSFVSVNTPETLQEVRAWLARSLA